MIYKISYKDKSQIIKISPDNINTKYIWIDMNKLDYYNLSPKGIIKIIKEDKIYINHMIINDK